MKAGASAEPYKVGQSSEAQMEAGSGRRGPDAVWSASENWVGKESRGGRTEVIGRLVRVGAGSKCSKPHGDWER